MVSKNPPQAAKNVLINQTYKNALFYIFGKPNKIWNVNIKVTGSRNWIVDKPSEIKTRTHWKICIKFTLNAFGDNNKLCFLKQNQDLKLKEKTIYNNHPIEPNHKNKLWFG